MPDFSESQQQLVNEAEMKRKEAVEQAKKTGEKVSPGADSHPLVTDIQSKQLKDQMADLRRG